MKRSKFPVIVVSLLALFTMFTACNNASQAKKENFNIELNNQQEKEKLAKEVSEMETSSSSNLIDKTIDTAKEVTQPVVEEVNESTYIQKLKDWATDKWNEYTGQENTEQTQSSTSTEWNVDSYPDYYRVIGNSNIDTNSFPSEGTVEYKGLDSSGRTLGVYASITSQMVKDRVGHETKWESNSEPSGWTNSLGVGWNTVNGEQTISLYNGKTYTGWFYNKSHLLADSLGGEGSRQNVITGTRQQNVGNNDRKGGMQYLEEKVRRYLLDKSNGVVYYSAIPVYSADEIVPRSVIVSALSDDGSINEQVEVYNTANGYTIDYNTGNFYRN